MNASNIILAQMLTRVSRSQTPYSCTHLNKLNQAQKRLQCLTFAELGGCNQLKHWVYLIFCCRTLLCFCWSQDSINNCYQIGNFPSYRHFFCHRIIHMIIQWSSDQAQLFRTMVVKNVTLQGQPLLHEKVNKFLLSLTVPHETTHRCYP